MPPLCRRSIYVSGIAVKGQQQKPRRPSRTELQAPLIRWSVAGSAATCGPTSAQVYWGDRSSGGWGNHRSGTGRCALFSKSRMVPRCLGWTDRVGRSRHVTQFPKRTCHGYSSFAQDGQQFVDVQGGNGGASFLCALLMSAFEGKADMTGTSAT